MSNDLNKIEAAVFRRVINHFKENTEVQNIDVMETAGFCRNCLSRWYKEEAKDLGIEITEDASKEIIYGMPYNCLLYTSPSPRDRTRSRMPSSA